MVVFFKGLVNENRDGTGRPRKTNNRLFKIIVQNRNIKHGYSGRLKQWKSFIRIKNRIFAGERAQKDSSFWRTFLFSSESKFNLHESDGRVFVPRK